MQILDCSHQLIEVFAIQPRIFERETWQYATVIEAERRRLPWRPKAVLD